MELAQLITQDLNRNENLRHCKRCNNDKPQGCFSTIAGSICVDCKTEKARNAAEAKLAKSRIPSKLSAWRETWPHIKIRQ